MFVSAVARRAAFGGGKARGEGAEEHRATSQKASCVAMRRAWSSAARVGFDGGDPALGVGLRSRCGRDHLRKVLPVVGRKPGSARLAEGEQHAPRHVAVGREVAAGGEDAGGCLAAPPVRAG